MLTALPAWVYLPVFVGSAVLTLLLVPVALRVASKYARFGEPGGYRKHDSTVPYLGGAALVVAFSAVMLLAAALAPPAKLFSQFAGLLAVAAALVLVGLVHDLRRLPMPVRLAANAGAGAALWALGVRTDVSSSTAVDLALTVVWVLGITSAFNLLDNMDGLSAGVAGIAAASLFVIAAVNEQYLVASLCAALVGCALGFLRHNYYPARIYMGEGGSNFFGFLLAALAIKLRLGAPAPVAYLVPVLVMAVPIFDTTLVVLTRLASRRSPFQGARDHTSHRLVAAGLPVPAALGLVYLGAFTVGWLALVVSRLTDATTAFLLGGLVLFIAVVIGVFLASTLPMSAPIVGLTPVGAVFKRSFDIVVGVPLAVLATPVILGLALASAVTLRAWPFFVQERIGRYGRVFRFWKIRSLPRSVPKYALKGNHPLDAPLPQLSRFLRQRHLDELPQLYAVVLGKMSLVGPRPKMPDEFEPVAQEYATLRTRVPQGCTCLWQVGVHTAGLPSDSPEYDYWYLRHWSMRLDVWILWRTALTLLGAGRHMSLEDIPVWMVGRRYQIPELPLIDPAQAELDRRAMSR